MRLPTLLLGLGLVASSCDSPPPPPVPGSVPDWAADVVWYQIFPERFRDGDTSNQPTPESLPSRRWRLPESWEMTAWGSDWYQRAPWEIERSDDFYDTVRLRRYGGDLQGVIDQLDYLEDLGITGIYFNPLFWARSEHKYDGNTFHHIDPYFGPDPEGDFALMATETSDPATWNMTAADALFFEMLQAAHARGIRVIIDGVFNHTGQDFFAFADFFEKRSESDYLDWYTVLAEDDPATPDDEFDWKGWWGHRPLPEFTDNEDGTDLHPGPKAYVFDATRKWMDPNGDGDPSDGVDGWRLDVVADVPVGFWTDWNAHVRTLNPEAYTVAELWEDASETVALGGFSATMNYYGFAFPTKGYLVDGTMSPEDFAGALNRAREAHAPEVAFAVQNLIDSHDTDRSVSMVVNARRGLPYAREDWEVWFDYDWGDRNSARADEGYPLEVPSPEDREIQRMIALFQMTYVGAPMVYYGTEAGMWSGDDPDDRQPMWWPDIEFEPVANDPRTGPIDPMVVGFDADVHSFYRDVIALRRSHPALSRGTFLVLTADNEQHAIAFAREHEEQLLVVALNRSDDTAQLSVAPEEVVGPGEGLYPVFTTGNDAGVIFSDGTITLTIPPRTGAAFLRTGVE